VRTVFDIGMFDGADTRYYLEEGYRVVAVEANPRLVENAAKKFHGYISSGQLFIVNRIIGSDNNKKTLYVSGDDLGSSSILEDRVAGRNPAGSYDVEGITIQELIKNHGIPYFLKVDIEGADHLCVQGLSNDIRPEFLSFEAGSNAEELVAHAHAIGYSQFKVINQCNFLTLGRERRLYDRVILRMIRMLGYAEPKEVRRAGRFFRLGHSSGPAPWCSDGSWVSKNELISQWRRLCASGDTSYWYDIHAR